MCIRDSNRSTVKVRSTTALADLGWRLPPHAGLLDELSDPVAYPDVAAVRDEVLSWRFYDTFRVDADAPARRAVVGTRTQVLAADGSDLPAAVRTIIESAWARPFADAVADAFDGATVQVEEASGRFELTMRQPGMLRELAASEWSDGTLRYVLMATALHSPRPPSLLVLNEPETSLHPQVLPALGRLIKDAATHTQVVVITHLSLIHIWKRPSGPSSISATAGRPSSFSRSGPAPTIRTPSRTVWPPRTPSSGS